MAPGRRQLLLASLPAVLRLLHLLFQLLHIDLAHLDVHLARTHHILEQLELRLELLIPLLQGLRLRADRALDRRRVAVHVASQGLALS